MAGQRFKNGIRDLHGADVEIVDVGSSYRRPINPFHAALALLAMVPMAFVTVALLAVGGFALLLMWWFAEAMFHITFG